MFVFANFLLSAGMLIGVDERPKLVVQECEFAETYAFNRVDCEIELTNLGTKAIHVVDIVPVTPRDMILPAKVTVEPKATVYLHAIVDTGNSFAKTRHRFNLKTDEPGHEQRIASARGFVLNALDQVAPKLNFGVVDLSHGSPKKSILLGSHEVERFQIVKILDKPNYIEAELDSDRQNLSASIKADAPWGMQDGYIKLAINTPNQREIWVAVSADIHGEIIAASNPLDLGLLRYGNRNEHLMRLTSRSEKDFKMGTIALDGLAGSIDILPCVPQSSGCRLVRLVVSDQQPAGAIRGGIWFSFPEYAQKMRVDVLGLILKPDAHVEEVNPFKDNSLDDKDIRLSSSISSNVTRNLDLSRALKRAVDNDGPAPLGNGPLLKWTVANGKTIHGFQVFRADSESGPFIIANKALVESMEDEENVESYQYRDNTAESGKTYWYYIGVVNNDGTKQQLSGPQKVTAK